ncbi:MAG: low molecular weight phosphotyrosine protein phosphatase [Cyclobacteriaceae bacterium]|nr:low molecular weight phosphotyrosine protein phosphatase [Cyclobacteriaceae bacterium]
MKKVLFVCLGNICRSPMAEAIFNRLMQERNLSGQYESDSCGTGNYHIGDQPDPRTIKACLSQGTPIRHACRQATALDLEVFDVIFAMDASNKYNLGKLANAGHHAQKIFLMRDFDPEAPGTDVPDPYWGTDENFLEVYQILERSLRHWLDKQA